MELSEVQLNVLKLAYEAGEKGIVKKKIRAQFHEYRHQIDSLCPHLLEEVNNYQNYKLRLLGLYYLNRAQDDNEYKIQINTCELLFKNFREHYIEKQDEHLLLSSLVKYLSVSRQQIEQSLIYLKDLPTPASSTTDLMQEDAFVEVSESILDYESFEKAIEQLVKWNSDRTSHIQVEELTVPLIDGFMENTQSCSIYPLLNDQIIELAYSQFNSGFYREAAINAVGAIYTKLRKLTGLEGDGDSLINKALSIKNPKILVGNINTPNGANEQKGIQSLALGLHQAIRNPYVHDTKKEVSRREASQVLISASIVLDKLQETNS